MKSFEHRRANHVPLLAPLCLGLAVAATGAGAQTAGSNVKPPKAQLWIDLSTGTMAGMPEMDVPAGGGLFGRSVPGLGPPTTWGLTRGPGVMPPRLIDIALHNSLRPGVEASQQIPSGMRMGESLPLLPPPPQAAPRETEPTDLPDEVRREPPRGRILIYWGCSEAVPSGQPRVIDLARAAPTDFAQAFAGRMAADRGPRVGSTHVLYPNERNRVALAPGSSLIGEHQVKGEGVPASMRFALGAAQDIMPPIQLTTQGTPADSIVLNWATVPHARAYFLHAFGKQGEDMVMWSSSEKPDSGFGLFDYLPNATIDRWTQDGVLLPAAATQCNIPKGIFAPPAGSTARDDSATMLRMMAYGGETNLVHPPRPADPRAPWEPEWAVRVRVKAHTLALLGEDAGGRRGTVRSRPAAPGAAAPPASPDTPTAPPAATPTPPSPTLPGGLPLPNPGNILRGIFGR